MKRLIRLFAVRFEQVTRNWVVPYSVWEKINKGDKSVRIDLSDIAVKWGTRDPEFILASTVLSRLELKAKIRKESHV